jgi:hypothetical protein
MNRQVVAFDHNRLLKKVAGEVLEPLGLMHLGRSRTWIDDHGWWATVVAFDPSGYGRGTYLKVGVSLLWHPVGGLSFDTDLKDRWKTPMGRHETQFIETRHPEWFERDVRAFTDGAVTHLNAIRSRPNGLAALAARLERSDGFWDCYHRAVACGLTRNVAASERDFLSVLSEPDPWDAEWLADAKTNAATLRGLLAKPADFERQVAGQIVRCRAEARLAPLGEDAIAASLRAGG